MRFTKGEPLWSESLTASLPITAAPNLEMNERVVRILRAAQDAFLAQGYHGASTDVIQAAAGVSKATIYKYFSCKEELFKAAITYHSREFLANIKHIAEENEDPAAFLYQFGLEFLHALVSPSGQELFRLMVAEARRFPEVGRMFYSGGPKLTVDIVEQFLRAAHERGALNVPDPALSAERFVSMVRGEIFLRCLMGVAPRPSETKLKSYIRSTVDSFLAAHAASSRP